MLRGFPANFNTVFRNTLLCALGPSAGFAPQPSGDSARDTPQHVAFNKQKGKNLVQPPLAGGYQAGFAKGCFVLIWTG